MAIRVMIPTPLRPYTDKQESVEIEANTIGELLDRLMKKYQPLRKHLLTDEGKLRSFVNLYVNDEDIRYLEKEQTVVKDTDVVSIVPSIAGGSQATVEEEVAFSHEEIKRYSRHLIMPEVGMEGQAKLKKASVLLIGAGGLGSPLGMYLSAAGIGRIGLVDFDVVDSSNLQRQIIYSAGDVGRAKLDVAKERLSGINPHITIETHPTRLSSRNALELFADYDVIIDGTDNFPTRYLVNDACVILGKPNVYGSIFRFEGQVSVFFAKEGPCYRCLYPEPPPPGLVPSCAEGGVLGVLPGVVGTLQAVEAIKLILGEGDPLVGNLLLFDALKMDFRKLNLRKDPDCVLCGHHVTSRELVDYEEFCGIPTDEADEGSNVSVPTIRAEELKTRLDRREDVVLLDVREPVEWQIVKMEGAELIPLGRLPQEVHRLNTADEMVVYCKIGARSARAVQFLRETGFRKVKNLEGGIDAWAQRVDPSLPRY
jgi:adenylyltransferase/sulfurtransferase